MEGLKQRIFERIDKEINILGNMNLSGAKIVIKRIIDEELRK